MPGPVVYYEQQPVNETLSHGRYVMKLSVYDNKHVRITLKDSSVYEGIPMYNSRSYNESEWGKKEDGFQLPGILIGRSEIRSVESLEDREDGPWGKFSGPFGSLEEETLLDWGADLVDEVLFCEDPEHVIRMLRCMKHFADPESGRGIPEKEKNLGHLRELLRTTDDPEAAKLAGEVLELMSDKET